MEWLIGMTVPGLVLALSVLGAYEVIAGRRGRRHGRQHGTVMASTGFDLLQEALYPSKRYELEERDAQALMAEEDDDGAPPRSSIDLSRGTAVIRLSRAPQQPGDTSRRPSAQVSASGHIRPISPSPWPIEPARGGRTVNSAT